jgi:hypothetical protein
VVGVCCALIVAAYAWAALCAAKPLMDEAGKRAGLLIGRVFCYPIRVEQARLRQLDAWFPEACGPRCGDWTRWRASPWGGVTCGLDAQRAHVPLGYGRRLPYWIP